MKPCTPLLASALAVAGIVTAFAQSTAAPPPLFDQVTAAEYGTPPAPAPTGQLNFVQEPTASLSRDDGPGADFGKQLVDQINGDEKLKGSKITVVPEEGAVTLVGSTQTRAQAQQIAQMAAEKVGVAKVTNAIRASEIYIEVAPPQQAPADTGDTQANQEPADAAQAQEAPAVSQPKPSDR